VLADLDDVAVVHDQDQIGVLDRGQAVGDDEAGAPLHQILHAFLDQDLSAGVDRRGRLIQDQDLRIAQEGAGDRQQLLLALGDVGGFLVDFRLVAVFQGADEVVHIGGVGSGDDFLVAGSGLAVADVVHDRSGEQPGVLQDHAEAVAQVVAREAAGVDAVHVDGAAVELIEAHQQLDDRGLAGPGRTDDGHLLPGADIGGEVVDDDLAGIVAEVDVLEGDVAADGQVPVLVIDRNRIRRVRAFLRFLEELEDALGGGRRRLHDVHDLGGLRDRLVEAAHILDEGLDVADRHGGMDGQIAAQDADADIAEVADEVGDRLHESGDELGLPGGVIQPAVEVVEFLDGAFLAVERLHDDMSAVHLFDVPVHIAQGVLLGDEVLLGMLDDVRRRESGQRDDDQRHQRHLPADAEHHPQDADDGDDRGQHLLDRLVQALRYGVDIVGDAGEDFAVGLPVKVGQRQAVDLGGGLFAQIVGALLGDAGGNPALDVAEQGGDNVQDDQHLQRAADGVEVDAAGAGVLGHQAFRQLGGGGAQDLRTDDREDRGGDGEDDDDDNLQGERLQVMHQLGQRALEILGLVAGDHARTSGSAHAAHAGLAGGVRFSLTHGPVPPWTAVNRRSPDRRCSSSSVPHGCRCRPPCPGRARRSGRRA